MALDNKELTTEFSESPGQTLDEAKAMECARSGQEQPPELKDQARQQEERRGLGRTKSSESLPRVEWSYDDQGRPVIEFSGKQALHKLDSTPTVTDSKAKTAENGKKAETEQDALLNKMEKLNPPLSLPEQKRLRADLAEIDKLPEEQRQKIYKSLEKIAHGQADTRLTDQQRRELVMSLAHQIAHPESIKDGEMTGTPANAERMMASGYPEYYADIVAKLATDGTYTSSDGRTVEAKRDGEGRLAGKSDPSSQRSLTSELFQDAVVQLRRSSPRHRS
ncbi:MAG TPA: hypothetical protein V6D08_19775 [Candidatus Obscuribacterales bacterium]